MPYITREEKIKAGFTGKYTYIDPVSGEKVVIDELSDNVGIVKISEDPTYRNIENSKYFTEVRDLESGNLIGYNQIMGDDYYENDYMKDDTIL